MEKDEVTMLHYAVGLLVGLGDKYGVVDITIYYNSLRIRIERVQQEEKTDG